MDPRADDRSRAGTSDAATTFGSAFQNIASNGDANASTQDSHVVATLKSAGTYYIAFREETLEDATFTVSLQGKGVTPQCDPEEDNCAEPPSGGPFSSSYCAGTAMSPAQALARLRLPTEFRKHVGTFEILQRSRACFDVGGCTEWADSKNLSFASHYDGPQFVSNRSGLSPKALNGDMFIEMRSNAPYLFLGQSPSQHGSYKHDMSFAGSAHTMKIAYDLEAQTPVTGQATTALTLSAVCKEASYDQYKNLCGASGADISSSSPVKLPGGADSSYSGKLTNQCLWVKQGASERRSTGGNTYTFETESVIYGAL